jgi:uncharacterized protein YxeA
MKNKKIIIQIIVAIILLFLIFSLIRNHTNQKTKQQIIQQYSQDYKDPNSTEQQASSDWQNYQNTKIGYSIKYHQDWHIFTDDADTELKDINLENGETLKQGSSVFWSNKESIDFTQETKPEDFHLLGLIEYEKENIDIDQMAKLLGFTEEVGTQNLFFQAKNLIGKEYISLGASEESPRATIIFKDNNRFFVFHLGFVGNDTGILKTMEEIVGTFGLDK